MSGILTRSSTERNLLASFLPEGPQVRVLLPWVPVERLAAVPLWESQPLNLVLDGSESEGLHWFLKHILPKVHAHYPQMQVTVYGSTLHQPHDIPDTDRNIQFAEPQASLEQIYASCGIVAVPRILGGTAHFTLGALAAGRPVVASRIANRGVGAPEHSAILLAEDPDEFAGHLLSLLADAEQRQHLAQGGRAFVTCNHDYDSSVRDLERFYSEVLYRNEAE